MYQPGFEVMEPQARPAQIAPSGHLRLAHLFGCNPGCPRELYWVLFAPHVSGRVEFATHMVRISDGILRTPCSYTAATLTW